MSIRIVLAAGMATAVALLGAGCGGGSASPASGGGTLGAGASVAPASSVAFVAIDSDLGSPQWQAVNALLAKIPQHDALLAKLRRSFERKTKLSWADDVRPALGPEIDLAVLPGGAGAKPQAVLLTQPPDRAKLDALVHKLSSARGRALVTGQVAGWSVVAESRAGLDAVASAARHLADNAVYREAIDKLAGDALVHAYANGAEAGKLVSALPGAAAGRTRQVVWAAADVVATDGGLRVDGFLRGEPAGSPTEPYTSTLIRSIPAGALAVLDFQARHEAASRPAPSSPLSGALQRLGNALGGETALYVSPGTPIPAVTLVTQASDPQAVVDALNALLAGAAKRPGGSGRGLDLGSLFRSLHLSHAVVGSSLVVSTSQQAIEAFKGAGQKLADDGTFAEARSASGMPDRTSGFLYVNLKDALPVLQGLASLAGVDLTGGVDLSALRTLTAYGTGSTGGVSGFTAFVEVR